jgi:hypothetical protein
MVFNHDKVCQWLATCWWFSPGTLISSTNKTNRLDIAEILSKVALNTITPNHIPCCIFFYSFFFGDKRTSNTILFLCTKTGDCYWIESREKQLSFFGVKNNSGRLFYQEQFLFGMNETFDHHRMNAYANLSWSVSIRTQNDNIPWTITVGHPFPIWYQTYGWKQTFYWKSNDGKLWQRNEADEWWNEAHVR